jgi:hypothetical protein
LGWCGKCGIGFKGIMGSCFYSLFPDPYSLFLGCSGTKIAGIYSSGLASQMKD